MADKKPTIPAPSPTTGWSVEFLGEEKYCELANAYGCFNPKAEQPSYRPPLGLLEAYRAQEAAKSTPKKTDN